MHSEQDFDEIAAWLSENVSGCFFIINLLRELQNFRIILIFYP